MKILGRKYYRQRENPTQRVGMSGNESIIFLDQQGGKDDWNGGKERERSGKKGRVSGRQICIGLCEAL